jgi:peptide deformylase
LKIVDLNNIPKAEDVPLDDPMEVFKVCKQMEMVCIMENGVGLAAVQVGIPWKLFIMKGVSEQNPFVSPGRFGYFVNCEYRGLTEKGLVVSVEGCLSIRSPSGQLRSFRVERFNTIQITGLKLIIQKNALEFEKIDEMVNFDQDGIILQHETDHQNSKTIADIGKEVFVW